MRLCETTLFHYACVIHYSRVTTRRSMLIDAAPREDRAFDLVMVRAKPMTKTNACSVMLRSNRERCSHSLGLATRQENCRHRGSAEVIRGRQPQHKAGPGPAAGLMPPTLGSRQSRTLAPKPRLAIIE